MAVHGWGAESNSEIVRLIEILDVSRTKETDRNLSLTCDSQFVAKQKLQNDVQIT